MGRNQLDLQALSLRQRVLKEVGDVDLSTTVFNEPFILPVALGPVGLTGMYARRGEVQAARAAVSRGIAFTMSSVSVCPIEEVQPQVD
ncbi:alpha-hydroxy-acid oxidizing protein, partial [Staphylococcus aureus]